MPAVPRLVLGLPGVLGGRGGLGAGVLGVRVVAKKAAEWVGRVQRAGQGVRWEKPVRVTLVSSGTSGSFRCCLSHQVIVSSGTVRTRTKK